MDRALDVYTKVIRKYPAAVVLHAPKKRHVFMSYDGLFIQRKGRYSLFGLCQKLVVARDARQ